MSTMEMFDLLEPGTWITLVAEHTGASKDWLSRYCERKAMEERRRIEDWRLLTAQATVPSNDDSVTPPEKSAGPEKQR